MANASDRQIQGAQVAVVGAGIGGLTAALLLQSRGAAVTIYERHGWVGGKLRAIQSVAGPVDAGPTVLTLKHVFDEVFTESGGRIDDYVEFVREPLLARHFWRDGATLDLWDDPERSADAIGNFSGANAAQAYRDFATESRTLFDLFDTPMMRAAVPSVARLAVRALSTPARLPVLLPGRTLASALRRRFADPRLRQLFGRYATYVGGAPNAVPALLMLVCRAEAAGVWRAPDGLSGLAEGLARRFRELGGTIRLDCGLRSVALHTQGLSLTLDDGTDRTVQGAVFNGDARALSEGLLGDGARQPRANRAQSLSARVWSFADRLDTAPDLAHHNVFFAADPEEEFRSIAAGRMPRDPTVYVCAQDRGSGATAPTGPERFEIILNAAPLTHGAPPENEVDQCRETTFSTLAAFGFRTENRPPDEALTTPRGYAALFPGSAGALYGASPEGMTSSLRRPRARTKLPGLYLAGGTTHPGPGLPMAALSGRHAADAVTEDLHSI